MQAFFFVLVLVASFCLSAVRAFEEGDAAINAADCLADTDADSLRALGTDIAQVKFNVQANFAGQESMYSLYATSDNCFQCAKTLVMSGNTNGCTLMYTTFPWTFVVVDTVNK